MRPIQKKFIASALALMALVGVTFYAAAGYEPFSGEINDLGINITEPDALIRSYSLSRLPPDLLRVPVVRDVLTEDFVDYYEHNEDREALLGTMKRIAYEHKLDLSERVLEAVFDEPAEVALWRDKGGRLSYFALAMTRNALAKAIGLLLPLSDAQISSIAKPQGVDVPVLIVEYGYGHRLALLAKGSRVVVLSDPGLLLKRDKTPSKPAAAVISELLDKGAKISPFARHFHLGQALPKMTHEIVLGFSVFAFGYEHFAPGLAAFDFSFDAGGKWQSSALLDVQAQTWNSAGLWSAVPYGPGLCASLPADWKRFVPMLGDFNAVMQDAQAPPELLQSFGGAVAACWYNNARFYAPLFVTRLQSVPNAAQAKAFFRLASLATRSKNGGTNTDPKTGEILWRGKIDSAFDLNPAAALSGEYLLFSPDAALVEKALDVAAKRYPSAADGFAKSGGETLAVIDPERLAELLRREMFASLPRDEEPVFRSAAEYYLEPRLQALARYPAQRLRLANLPSDPKNTRNNNAPRYEWEPLLWEPLQKIH